MDQSHEFIEPSIVQAEKSQFWKYITWSFASLQLLKQVEKKILAYVKWPLKCFYVELGKCVGQNDQIWTLHAPNTESDKTPLLLIHGMGAGVAHWVMNLEELAKDRTVYAIDVLGYARSSRPKFSKDPMKVEKQFVQSIEAWRRKMNLQKVILVGHSMGGYLSASYAMDYPERVQHLVLADAWGLPEYKPRQMTWPKLKIPWWVKVIIFFLRPLNPLVGIRFVGPWGQKIIIKVRPDILDKFKPKVTHDTREVMAHYIHQCNAQNPTGESAFHSMCAEFGYAKNPMVPRICNIDSSIGMTMIYGSRSWVDNSTGEVIKNMRTDSFVEVKIIDGAGHHVYTDKPELFNQIVLDACEYSDKKAGKVQ